MTHRILFVVTGVDTLVERSVHQHTTWCREARCIFATNVARPHENGSGMLMLPTADDACDVPPYWKVGVRFMRALAAIKALSATWTERIDWYAFVDDDAVVYPHRLAAFLNATNLQPTRRLYMGDFANLGKGFACGGGGLVTTRATLEHLDLDRCARVDGDRAAP